MKQRNVLLAGKVSGCQNINTCTCTCFRLVSGISVSPEVEARQRRSVEREARRRRRREKRQKEGTVNHEEGVSTDDELLETNRLKFVGDEGTIMLTTPTFNHAHLF